MSRKDERQVAAMLEAELGIKFSGKRFRMDWGEADDVANIGPDRYLFLEVERSQNHPSTNVLKYWPFLDAKDGVAAVLVHVFFPDSRGQSGARRALNDWVAAKMHDALAGRFRYRRIALNQNFLLESASDELKSAVHNWTSGTLRG